MRDSDRQVARRRVFYIPGYDPIHPRRYRELYRKEGAAQAALSDYEIALSPKTGEGPYGWHVDAEIEGAKVGADVEVLVWSDIVRSSMNASIPATYWQMLRTAWIYIASGALRRLMWLRKGPVIAALYPVAMLLGQLLVSVLAALFVATLLVRAGQTLAGLGGWGLPVLVENLLWWPAIVTVTVLGLRFFKARDTKLFAYYLMHDFAFGAAGRGRTPEALEARMAEFGDTIAAALASDADEVLVVGHSSGAHLAVSVLADLIRAGRVPANGPVLSFLTLGQVIPMISFLPRAERLRGDLHFLSTTDRLTWVDVTAPGDGCAFALCDPVAVTGVQPDGAEWPLIYSAAFTRTLRDETWEALRWNFFRLHFQYLCAFDNLPGKPDDYDYFRITAGPKTLAGRYIERPSSRSRIDVAASKYTSIAA